MMKAVAARYCADGGVGCLAMVSPAHDVLSAAIAGGLAHVNPGFVILSRYRWYLQITPLKCGGLGGFMVDVRYHALS